MAHGSTRSAPLPTMSPTLQHPARAQPILVGVPHYFAVAASGMLAAAVISAGTTPGRAPAMTRLFKQTRALRGMSDGR
jgi:hypothetical protein